MVFKDYYDFYYNATLEFDKLSIFEKELDKILELQDKFKCTFLDNIYNHKYTQQGYNYVYDTAVDSQFNTYTDSVTNVIRSINVFEVGRIFNNLQNNLDNNTKLKEHSLIYEICKQIELINSMMYQFLSGNFDTSTFAYLENICGNILLLKTNLNKLRYSTDFLEEIYTNTLNNVNLIHLDGFKTLELYYYDQEIDLNTMSKLINTINNLYDNLCNLCDVSTTQYKLLPIKVESGSLFTGLIGNEQIMELIKLILIGTSTLCFKNFTKQGRFETSYKNAKDTLEIVKLAQEVGLTVSEKDSANLEGILGQVIENANDIVCAGKLSVDGENLNENAASQLFANATNNKMLDVPTVLDELASTSEIESDNCC